MWGLFGKGKAGGAQGSSCYYPEEIMAPGQVKEIITLLLLLPTPIPISIPSMDKLDHFLLLL